MAKTLKEIIKNSSDIFIINSCKPEKHDISTWKFTPNDERWNYGEIDTKNMKMTTLRRGENFFNCYRYNIDSDVVYLVDPDKAVFRSSVKKYVNTIANYSVKTNDISKTKNDPSFRITEYEMKKLGIDNFIDLCYHFREYSAIGTGYTRDIRNLLVLDIDVDCTKQNNKEEVDSILEIFKQADILPEFIIFNKSSKHIQMQWLIKDLQYKKESKVTVDNVIKDLMMDKNKNCELEHRKTDFTEITPYGIDYRRFSLAMCDISSKRKFGDKHYTFWKAKNPMSALEGLFDLELKMPQVVNNEITYVDDEYMKYLFSTKERRRIFFEEAKDITEIYEKLKSIMGPLIQKITERKVKNIKDAEDVSEKSTPQKKRGDKKRTDYGESRNEFVKNCTQLTTWEIAKEHGYRTEHITNMKYEDLRKFRSEIYVMVKEKFNLENEKHNGVWPGTVNMSAYSISEFNKTFESSFHWSMQKFNNQAYSNMDREKSLAIRHDKKERKKMLVMELKSEFPSCTKREILKKANSILSENGESLTMTTLKRYLSEIKSQLDPAV